MSKQRGLIDSFIESEVLFILETILLFGDKIVSLFTLFRTGQTSLVEKEFEPAAEWKALMISMNTESESEKEIFRLNNMKQVQWKISFCERSYEYFMNKQTGLAPFSD